MGVTCIPSPERARFITLQKRAAALHTAAKAMRPSLASRAQDETFPLWWCQVKLGQFGIAQLARLPAHGCLRIWAVTYKNKAQMFLLSLKVLPALTVLKVNIMWTRCKRFSEPVEKPGLSFLGRIILLYVIGLLTLKPKEGCQASKYFTTHRS